MNLLIAEPDPRLSSLLKTTVRSITGIRIVETARDYATAFDKIHSDIFDLVILNSSLDDEFDGIDLCARIRQHDWRIPVLMISSITTAVALEPAFSAGANDFLCQPLDVREVKLRVQSWVTRYYQGISSKLLYYRDLYYDPEIDRFGYREVTFQLAKQPRVLLFLLLKNPEDVLSESYIRAKLWGDELCSDASRNIRAIVHRLRATLPEDCSAWIRTVKGRGYLLQKDGLLQRERLM